MGSTRQGQPASSWPLVAGFSSPPRLVCRQPSPRGSTRKTPGCQVGRSVGEKGGGVSFSSIMSLSHTNTRSQGETLNIKNTFLFFAVAGTIFPSLSLSAGSLASNSNITYEPCGIFAPGHLLLYCSSVNTTKTAAGQEPRLQAARNHTSVTTSSAPTQV